MRGDAIRVAKEGQTATSFVKLLNEERWAAISESPIAIMHARAKTKGAATDNANNHPVFGLGWVVTHNGMVHNDDELFEYHENKRFAEVDTAAIPLVLSKGKNYLDSLHQTTTLGGNVTAAIWSDDHQDKVALLRLGSNDLYLFYDEPNRILYWSSTFTGANVIPQTRIGPLRFATMSHLPEDRIYVLEPEGVQVFKVKRNAFNPPRKWSHPHKAPVKDQQTTQSIARGRSSKTGAVVTDGSTFKWFMYDEENSALSKVKPHPLQAGVNLDRNIYTLDYIVKRFRENPKLANLRVETGYGNWDFDVITKDDKEFLKREFKPHKRIKKFWAETFQPAIPAEAYTQLLTLPFPANAVPTPLDGKLPIEGFNEKLVNPGWAANSSFSVPGFMCPWCGIHGRGQVWQACSFRCWFCGIRSIAWVEQLDKGGVILVG